MAPFPKEPGSLMLPRQQVARPAERPRPSRRLRVVRLYHHLEVGGIESRLVDLLPRLDRELFDVQLICTRRRGPLAPKMEQRGIPVRLCRHHSKLPLLLSTLPLTRLLRRLEADIVHGHNETPAQAATVAAQRARVPIIIANFHNVDLFQATGQLRRERKQSPDRDAVIHVSQRARTDYLERVRPTRHSSVVIYNGVDIGHFSTSPGEERLEALGRELQVEGRRPVLLSAARLNRHKAHGDLLTAFAEVREAFPRAVLLLAGEGRRREEIEAMVLRRGLQGAVRLIGNRRDIRDLYHLADVNTLSSTREGFSNVVLEAMAAGLPQVVTDVGGNREATGDSGAVLLVPPRDPSTLAAELRRVLERPELARSMSVAARKQVQRFSVEEQVAQTEQLYLGLARRKGLID